MAKINDIKQAVDIVEVVDAYGIQLRPKGQEFVGLCPFHADSKPSLNVNRKKQVFLCPVCDTKGDVFDFVMQKEGCTIQEAAERLQGKQYTQHVQQNIKRGAAQEWVQVQPTAAPGQIVHHQHGRPAVVWQYVDEAGKLLGLICRFNTEGGKEIIPYTYRKNEAGRTAWMFRGFDRPRPLYALQAIAAQKTKIVILTEGEKTADAAQRLFPKAVVSCWQGGAKAYSAANWLPLKGRKVIMWPDADAPGIEAMRGAAQLLAEKGITTDVKIVLPPDGVAKGWDLWDAEAEGWDAERAKAWALANLHDPADTALNRYHNAAAEAQNLALVAISAAHQAVTPPAQEKAAEVQPKQDSAANNRYFEVLGFVKDGTSQKFAFYVKAAKIVVQYGAAGLASKSNLLTLAPMDYWEYEYPSAKRGGGFNLDMAIQVMISIANSRGVFGARLLRGRGAWYDEGRIVLHLGGHLNVQGMPVPLGEIRSRYVYEAGEAMDIITTNPLETAKAVRLMEVARLLNWDRDINAYLLVGWCVIAPFCGALRWRPHIWLTGGAGTGKSWVFREIIRRLLGSACLAVQSETSEAGLRQMLGSDAIPVVFDEAEGETRHALERMEHVLALMRAASTSDGGIVAKGTAFGRGQTFETRSCFACASINSPVTLQADRTRVTNLVLTEPDPETKAGRWAKLQELYATVITEEFVHGLHARTLRLLPTILKNADVFGAAAAALLGQQRIGDQLGGMLAGAYSLHRTDEVDYQTAMEFIQGKDWREEITIQDTKDEFHLLATLAEKLVRVDGMDGGTAERNLGELVRIAAGLELDSRMTLDAAQTRLKRIGFKIEKDFLMVSTTSESMRAWMRDTAWAKNYHRTLARLEGAEMVASARFASGIQSRAVKVPLTYFK